MNLEVYLNFSCSAQRQIIFLKVKVHFNSQKQKLRRKENNLKIKTLLGLVTAFTRSEMSQKMNTWIYSYLYLNGKDLL